MKDIMLKLRNDERGIAALLISMLLIIISSLIVFGFAEISNNNQHEALVNLLNTEANAAAESGINEAEAYIQTQGDIPTVSNCVPNHLVFSYNLSPGVSLSCVNVSTSTQTLTQGTLSAGSTIVWPLNDTAPGGFGFKTLTFSFGADTTNYPYNGSNNCSTYSPGSFPTFQRYVSSCNFPILRVDLAFFPNFGGNVDSARLISYTSTIFIQPYWNAGGSLTGQINSVSTPQAIQLNRDLAQSKPALETCYPNFSNNTCKITLVDGDAVNPKVGMGTPIYARITPMYLTATQVQVSGTDITTGSPVSFSGVEAVVDSTAKAQNVESRIQAYINIGCSGSCITEQSIAPNNALETNQTLCKNLAVYSVTNAASNTVVGCGF